MQLVWGLFENSISSSWKKKLNQLDSGKVFEHTLVSRHTCIAGLLLIVVLTPCLNLPFASSSECSRGAQRCE